MASGFDENCTFARQVRDACSHGTLSHAVILSGNGERSEAARYLAAAYLCGESQGPCMRCNVCRKVMGGIHPDVITVTDEEHAELQVEAMRQLKQDAYIRPNEGSCKVYLFADSDQLNERDQNVLLKIVEEGPAYAAFIFCTETARTLLPTIRSRCTEMKLQGDDAPADMTEALELCRVVGSGRGPAVTAYFNNLELKKIKRQELQALLQNSWYVAAEVLLLRAGKAPDEQSRVFPAALAGLRDGQLRRLVQTLSYYAAECRYNVGTGHVIGGLLSDLSDIGR